MVASGVVLRTFRSAPSPHAWRRGAPRLRPRVARVLWTTPLATRHTHFISSMDGYTGHASGAAGSQGFARAGGVRLKEGVPTLGHVRGKDPADTSYREAMTKETPGGME